VEVLLFLCFGAVSSIPPVNILLISPSFLDSKVAARENSSEQRITYTKWRQSFLLLLVNLWAQVKSQSILAKAI
jgi:hypothetical protein